MASNRFTVNIHQRDGRRRIYTGLHYVADSIDGARTLARRGITYMAEGHNAPESDYVAQIIGRHGLMIEEIEG